MKAKIFSTATRIKRRVETNCPLERKINRLKAQLDPLTVAKVQMRMEMRQIA